MQRTLREHLVAGQAAYFLFEEDKMYTTKRESELLQAYLSNTVGCPKETTSPEDLF